MLRHMSDREDTRSKLSTPKRNQYRSGWMSKANGQRRVTRLNLSGMCRARKHSLTRDEAETRV